MMQMDIHPDPEQDLKNEKQLKVSWYDEKTLPPHLEDPNFYFDMPQTMIKDSELQRISEDEIIQQEVQE